MNKFTCVKDIEPLNIALAKATEVKANPFADQLR
jgi:hypothetical protein